MDGHRLVQANDLMLIKLAAPFSCFDLVEHDFGGNPAIHRCFSLARSFGAESLVVEHIPAVGLIQEENVDISQRHPGYSMGAARRLSFWKTKFSHAADLDSAKEAQLIGYAILKQDVIPELPLRYDGWHIFDATFKKYDHPHNCVPLPHPYRLCVAGRRFNVPGVLYGQQNALTKACAHVALRSLLSRLNGDGDVSYREMNRIAADVAGSSYDPSEGLTVEQMRAIMDRYRVPYQDVDYALVEKAENDAIRNEQPFQKYLYAGIESGCGALLGFGMAGPEAGDSKHIIPFYGHTFNKDTWVPDAELAYFNIGGNVGYIPSETWTSSFIGHDDNFGPNFCIPRLYVSKEKVDYVVELQHSGVCYSGVVAEAQALDYLYSLVPHLPDDNFWLYRLAVHSQPDNQSVVLRALNLHRAGYMEHLRSIRSWEGGQEDPSIISLLETLLPDQLWVVEVSLPHLFPANERKIGEIVLHANQRPSMDKSTDFGLFLLARLPGSYFFRDSANQYGPRFTKVPSGIKSHVDLIRLLQ